MSKTAIVVLSDPASGSDEALGRLFNAMFVAYELQEKGQDVALIFQGAGTRWVNEVTNPDHPAHGLFDAVKAAMVVVVAAAPTCSAPPRMSASGLALVREKSIPGTSGIVDLSRYLDEGFRLLTF